jgi:predicted NBD/HSP70 family sugar kinase
MEALLALRDHSALARGDLCRLLKRSTTTMTKVISDLIEDGLVVEAEVQRSREAGRPRTLLQLVPNSLQVAGIVLEPDAIHSAVLGLDLQARQGASLATPVAGQAPAITLEIIGDIVARQNTQLSQAGQAPISCVAIVLPGMTDTRLRTSLRSRVLGWSNQDIANPVEQRTGLPAVVHNNTRAMAFAEFRHLGLHEDQPLLFVQARSGLGASLVNSAIPSRHGHYGVSELGHIPIGSNAFNDRVAADANLMSVTNEPYLRAVLGLAPGEQEVLPVLEERCEAHDQLAKDLYQQTIANLARGLGIAINLLNPSIIVLGGIYAQASQQFVKDLEGELKQHAQEELTQDLHMQRSQLGRSGALQGAAIVAFDRLLRNPATYRRSLDH